MLNTKTCWGAALIWVAIAAIVGTVLWDVAGLAAPAVVWSQFLRSETAEMIKQYQTLLAGVLGFGLASFAYWFNGHQNRKVAAGAEDAQARTLAHALMLETERLEADCDLAASRFASLAEEAEKKRQGESVMVPAADRMILRRNRSGGMVLADVGVKQLSKLGANACSAVLMLRNAVADLDRETGELSREGGSAASVSEIKDIARAYSAVCLKCARVRPLLWTLARHGTEMADARDPALAPSHAEVDGYVKAAAARAAGSAGPTASAPRVVAVS